MRELFFKTGNDKLCLSCKVISSDGPTIDKECICTSNGLDFTTEIKNLHCFGSITYKNSGKSDNIGAMAEMDGEKNQHYQKWTTMSERVKSGTARPLLILQWFELEMRCLFIFILRKQ